MTRGEAKERAAAPRFFEEVHAAAWAPLRELVDLEAAGEDLLFAAAHLAAAGPGHAYALVIPGEDAGRAAASGDRRAVRGGTAAATAARCSTSSARS